MKTGRENEVLGENMPHKFHMTWPGMEPGASTVGHMAVVVSPRNNYMKVF
jgi:hypothetical protein